MITATTALRWTGNTIVFKILHRRTKQTLQQEHTLKLWLTQVLRKGGISCSTSAPLCRNVLSNIQCSFVISLLLSPSSFITIHVMCHDFHSLKRTPSFYHQTQLTLVATTFWNKSHAIIYNSPRYYSHFTHMERSHNFIKLAIYAFICPLV